MRFLVCLHNRTSLLQRITTNVNLVFTFKQHRKLKNNTPELRSPALSHRSGQVKPLHMKLLPILLDEPYQPFPRCEPIDRIGMPSYA
jgi:hypothetical protein